MKKLASVLALIVAWGDLCAEAKDRGSMVRASVLTSPGDDQAEPESNVDITPLRRAEDSAALPLGEFTRRGTSTTETRIEQGKLIRSYPVGKRLSTFSTNEDLTTPEASYASIHRAWAAEGDAAWARLSVPRIARRLPNASDKPLSPKQAERLLEAEIIEVQISGSSNAAVLATMPGGKEESVDIRWLERVNGNWLNAGNDAVPTLQAARNRFQSVCARQGAEAQLACRPGAVNPGAQLKRFTDFLRREGEDPEKFLLRAVAEHRLVVIGEVHHRPRYWQLNIRLIRSPEFANAVGVIYLELPANGQATLDQFLAAAEHDEGRVIDVLRDMLWMGWPDQSMLDFLRAVWEVNQTLPTGRKLRVVATDMERPWKKIEKREDWRAYEVDRDRFMAGNVERDLKEHADDPRHALFIVGYGHAIKHVAGPDGKPFQTAGWHLRARLGETNVYCVFPHSPVISNDGQTRGRIALGLFEGAFAQQTNQPVCFPLDHGPFGELVFDASMDRLTLDRFSRAFDAYLYLGPLETEAMSDLIPGFYTDDFARELDRRSRVTFGAGLVQAHGIRAVDGKSMVEWMGKSWGRGRREWSVANLGPLDAWEFGSDWKSAKVNRLLAELRQTDRPGPELDALSLTLKGRIEDFFQHGFRDITRRTTLEWGEFGTLTNGMTAMRYKYAATIWDKETITNNQVFIFGPDGKFESVSDVP